MLSKRLDDEAVGTAEVTERAEGRQVQTLNDREERPEPAAMDDARDACGIRLFMYRIHWQRRDNIPNPGIGTRIGI